VEVPRRRIGEPESYRGQIESEFAPASPIIFVAGSDFDGYIWAAGEGVRIESKDGGQLSA
jgi:hypothetical protein